jgi:hypothetical protein
LRVSKVCDNQHGFQIQFHKAFKFEKLPTLKILETPVCFLSRNWTIFRKREIDSPTNTLSLALFV